MQCFSCIGIVVSLICIYDETGVFRISFSMDALQRRFDVITHNEANFENNSKMH